MRLKFIGFIKWFPFALRVTYIFFQKGEKHNFNFIAANVK